MKKKLKILWFSDGVTPTGFANVAHGIIGNFPDEWEVHHVAINYRGDPHKYKHNIYPAMRAGDMDVWGLSRIREFSPNQFDYIFILNDMWVIDSILDEIRREFAKIPPIMVYFPVDADGFDERWFKNSDIITDIVTYTEFGKSVVQEVLPDRKINVIPHGTDKSKFFQIFDDRKEAKKVLFEKFTELHDSFIVLNANRNQPRKRLDLALEGFALFAQDKPENVLYYHHAGLKDVGWDVTRLAQRYGITDRLITTNNEQRTQKVPIELLNLIYNSTDVGLNTSMGEGWGLTSTEHAVTGAPQIVPDHSACRELFQEVGLLIPTNGTYTYENTLTIGRTVSPEDVAEQLNIIYMDKDLYSHLAKVGQDKFSSDEYSWKEVSEQFQNLFMKNGYTIS